MYLDTLKQTGDFLTLTRNNEFSLAAEQFTLSNGTLVEVKDTGVIQFTPATYGDKDIVLSSAVHGNETAPIEICDAFIQDVILQRIELAHRVLFIFGNPKSINIAERFVDENLNRLFNGAHENRTDNPEQIRAAKLESYVSDFFTSVPEGRYRCHYDLHTAIRGSKNEKFAVYPFLHGKPWKKSQLQFMLACGVNTILMMRSAATTFSYFSSFQFGADAFTVELGQVKPFGQNDMSRFSAVKQTLKALISQESVEYDEFNASDFELFQVHRTINRTCDAFSFPFPDSAVNFTGFAKGELLATDGDTTYFAEVEGEAIIFPNAKVALGQRALLTVVPLEVDENFV
ncbi:succinylglutamate desuccinylase [Pseudoalteromonas ardens]|uniref:Succinylglutamate desuccinylase n=1 Tax=Pseudoalteromonas rubra TaxID=43658 RepID=A0A0L0ELD6_9GAMM|nr:succinylglutamate desuccinylase [Pseudoalteromonas sp. R96]KNC65262.1 succinylglutamate desuccinylase [Pseudoalteromonas rubra]MDK1310814.1 succinylglutamate desuccinylase [Pseudoalteromonas sp. R96]